MPKGESALRVPEEKEPKKYTTQEIEAKFGSSDDDGNSVPTGDQTGIGAFPEIQKIIDEENKSIEKIGHLRHAQKERQRAQTIGQLEAGRRRQGGFTGENQLEELRAQLQKEISLDKQTRAIKPEPETIELNDEDVVDEAKEWHKRGYVASDEEALPPAIPDEVALPNAQRYLELEKRMEELETERKQIGRQKIGNVDHGQLLSVMSQETKAKGEMNKLEAYFRRNGVKIVQLEGIIRRAKKQAAAAETEKPTETKKIPEPKTHSAREVYDRGSYRVPIGGIGLGNIAGAMERGSGVLRHFAGPRAGEVESAPERTNEEALFDLDQDLLDTKKSDRFFDHEKDWTGQDSTAEIPTEKLLQKFFKSESKIYLDDKYAATILADKIFLHALDVENWDGKNLSVLKKVVGEISLENSDKLADLKKEKRFFRRFFKTDEEKRLETQTQALDRFAEALTAKKEDGSSSPQTKRLLRTMMKR